MELFEREQIENWISDFTASDALRAYPRLAPYADQILREFTFGAVEVGQCGVDEMEESHVRSALIERVGRMSLVAPLAQQVPGLCGDFLAWLQQEGRLSRGRLLGAYVRALGESFGQRVSGKQAPFVSPGAKIGRNEPCPCGSGKKYKKCCGAAA